MNTVSAVSSAASAFHKPASAANTSTVRLPYWEPPMQPDTWAGTSMQSEEFLETFYDCYVNRTYNDGYSVSKTDLGLCGDGIRSIYEYVFSPANYTRTILLSAQMHGQEIVGGFGLARFLHYVMDEPDQAPLFQYLRQNVRILVLPILNPSGFDQIPRRFGTPTFTESPLGVNMNSNFDCSADRWQNIVYDSDHPILWNAKGPEPFSEAETKLLVSVLKKYQYDIEFWIDCHTGAGWDQDVWFYYIDEDPFFRPKMLAAGEWISRIWAANKGVSVTALKNRIMDAVTSHKLRYAVTELGIPCATTEYVPGRFGGTENCSTDLYAYLLQFANIVTAGLNTEGKTVAQLQEEILAYKLAKK